MKIKKSPEDFLVEELVIIDNKPGFHVYKLSKKNISTPEAARILERKCNTKIKFCGNKDKLGITQQFISSKKKISEVNLEKEGSWLKTKYVGTNSQPLSLGSHQGNKFKIKIEVSKNKPFKMKEFYFPNYFGEQRFSRQNVEVGTAILNRDFKKAVTLIDDKFSNEFLEDYPNNYFEALKKIPKTILRIYLASVQSFAFNKELSKSIIGKVLTIADQKINFSKEKKHDNKQIAMKGWDSGDRRFLFREYPELSLEGHKRNAFVAAKNISFDGTHVEFELPKSSYATVCLRALFLEDITY